MSRFLALTRKEIAALLLLPAIYFVTAFIVLLDSFAFYLIVAKPGARAVFDDMAIFMLITSVVLYPLVIMRSFADENAEGTIETLLTAPVRRSTILFAKFTAAMVFVILSLLPGLVYAILLSYGGTFDWQAASAAFLSLFLSGAIAIAIGLAVSALAVSSVAAAAATCLILVFMVVAADVDPYAGRLAAAVNAISFLPHAKRWIAGELDTRGLVYFLSVTGLFLYYAWLAIGSREPSGKSKDRTTRRRMIVTYVLVTGGIILLVVQVAILHIQGFWETGAPILGIGLKRVPWPWLIPFILSVGCFIWSILTYRAARRAEKHSRPKPERKYATISESQVLSAPKLYYEPSRTSRLRIIVAALAALVIVLNLNWLTHYPWTTFVNSPHFSFLSALRERSWDVTQDKRNSLSSSTHRTLDALQGQAHVYAFLPDDGEYEGVPLAEEIRRLLVRYNDYNGRVISTFADPDSDAGRAESIARELEMPLEKVKNSLVVVYQGRKLEIPPSALAVPPNRRAQIAGDLRWVFDGEQGLTQTLMRLLDPRVPTVFFTSGHRELALMEGAWPERSASRLVAALTTNNLRSTRYTLIANQPIPPECDILVVASPRTPLVKSETDSIRDFLGRGGRLLFIAPPPDSDSQTASADPMNELIFELGGGYRDDIVDDKVNNIDGVSLHPLARMRSAGEGDARFVFPFTRSIRNNPRAPYAGWMTERLFESYPSSFSLPPGGGQPLPGPFTLAFRSWKVTDTGEARVAVLGSSRMAADTDISRGANTAALMKISQWLAGREESYEISPRPWTDRRIKLAGASLRLTLWVGLVAPSLAWLMAGLTVWWIRKE